MLFSLITVAVFLPVTLAGTIAKRQAYTVDPKTTTYCTWFYDNDGASECSAIPGAWGISLADFVRWNPSLTADCGNFKTQQSYCVEAFGEPAPSSTTTTTTKPATTTAVITTTTTAPSNGLSTPQPIQPGMVSNCNRFYLVKPDQTCATIAASQGITTAQFSTWNPEVGATCSGLWANVNVCVGIIGFTPTSAAPTTTKPANGVTTPSPIQENMTTNCNKFYKVKSGDQCGTISSANGIPISSFYTWNPAVGNTCASLWLDTYVCVGVIGSTPTSAAPATTTKPANGVTTPSPIQDNMTTNCNKFYKVKSGDQCGNLATANNIPISNFYSWNPAVGTTCASLWLDTYVCVGVIGGTATTTTKATTTTAGNGINTPTPIQPSMVSNCDLFYLATSGDTCATIAKSKGISVAQVVTWNPSVGSSCTGLWADTYVCISIIGHTPTTPQNPTTTKGNGITTPTPFQAGMTANCKSFHLVASGQTCATIASLKKITVAQFVGWNPAVKSDCTGMWANTYACVGV